MYNLFPWIFKFIRDRKEIHEITDFLERQNVTLFSHLKETLNPQMCRGFVDTFLAKKQNLEVWKLVIYYQIDITVDFISRPRS